MNDGSGFAKMVPGFDFLQGLVKNAGAAIPGVGQWVAPTLDPAELEKRIGDLRTVQFWLEQNARMLAATIQALEVQRMTLSTLKTMNVQMEDLRDSLKIKPAGERADKAPASAEATSRRKAAGAATPAVDPMQWWSALTGQFAQLAASAMKDTAGDAAKAMAGSLVKQSSDAAKAMAGDLVKQSFDAATAPARAVMDAVGKKRAGSAAGASKAASKHAAPKPKPTAPRRRRAASAKASPP